MRHGMLGADGPSRVLALSLACCTTIALADPTVEAVRIDGTTVRGELVDLSPRIEIRTDRGEQSLNWTDVFALDFAADEPADETDNLPVRIELSDGSSFAARVTGAAADTVAIALTGGATAELPLTMLHALVVHDASDAARQKLHEVRAEQLGREDVAVIARDDETVVLRGIVRGIDDHGVTFEWKDRRLPLPWDRLGGVIFARSVERAAPLTVRTTTGDVFAGRLTDAGDTQLTLRSSAFDALELALTDVRRIESRSDRVLFLSSLTPVRYLHDPLVGRHWPYALDQSLTGRPLAIGGRTVPRGVCLHSDSELTFQLPDRFHQFAATIGIVDEMAARGRARVRIVGDGAELWEGEVAGDAPPQEIVVPINGVRELTLVVGHGDGLDLSDHVGFGLARVLR